MGILKKLICTSVHRTEDLEPWMKNVDEGNASSTDESSIGESQGSEVAPVPHSALPTNTSTEEGIELANHVYGKIRNEMMDLGIPNDWISDFNVLGLKPIGSISGESSQNELEANNDFIVEEVRKALRPSKKKDKKKETVNAHKTSRHCPDMVEEEPTVYEPPTPFCGLARGLVQTPGRRNTSLLCADRADRLASTLMGAMDKPAELACGPAQQQSLLQKASEGKRQHGKYRKGQDKQQPISKQTIPSAIKTNKTERTTKKKTRFAPTLEERHTIPSNRRVDRQRTSIPSRLPKSKRDRRYHLDDDASSSCMSNDRSTSVISYDDNSVETMELLFNHMVCSSKNRIKGSDWLR